MPTNNFSGKTVFITGAGSGIGYATALAFSTAGANIVATDIVQQGLDNLGQELSSRGIKHRLEILNVGDEQAFQALADQLVADNWLPDVVLNNAGIAYLDSFVNTSGEQWRRTLDVNLLGVAYGSRIFIQHWQKNGIAGHLVNVASGAAVSPMPNMAAYAATKYAVDGLCEVIAMELSDSNIQVSCVYPGVINTAIVQHNDMMAMPREQVERLQQHYIDKGDSPDVVAQAIVKGVSAGDSYIFTGPGTTIAPLLKRLLPRKIYRNVLRKLAKGIGYL